MRDTYISSHHQEEPSWFIIDANNQTLGRLATKVSLVLQGKCNLTYSPATKFRNYVIVINADKINLTGRKKAQKVYYSHTGKPGELRQQTFEMLHQKFPHRIFELAIKRMLPSGFIKRHIHRRLKVYVGNDHPHTSQNPIYIDM
jgi:large subunit ribosomal protein L13